MTRSEIETAVDLDGGLTAAKDFGRSLALAKNSQLLAVASAVIAQADALPDFSQFTQQEHDFLAMARSVIEAYSHHESNAVE